LSDSDLGHYPFISVLMPVRNEGAFIERSLRSVLAQNYPSNRMEVLVADGMSQDDTRKVIDGLQQKHPNLKLVDNPGQIVATGLNLALQEARGEIIARVDGHCEIAPDYLTNGVQHILNEKVEAVGGPLETVGQSYVAQVIATAMSSRFGVGGSGFRLNNGTTQFTDTVAFPIYTRAVIDRAGPFDQELVRNQDDEYNYRLRKLGVGILLAADVRSRYYSRSTLRRLFSQYLQYGFWKIRVLQKHPRQMQPRQFVPLVFVLALFISLALWPVFTVAGYLAVPLMASYSATALLASALTAQKKSWKLLPLLPIAFAILHVSYGLGFVIGLLRFWNRWGERQEKVAVPPAIRGEGA
jgi:succinoglycan biosynthesis protein ExoA